MRYCIDLDKKLEIKELSENDYLADEKFKRENNIKDYDRHIFENESKAEIFLNTYKDVLKNLNNKDICKTKDAPCILYKRRYMILSILKLKNQTFRDSKRVQSMLKDLRHGDYMNLTDQTYTLTVKFKEVIKHLDGNYEYRFELP